MAQLKNRLGRVVVLLCLLFLHKGSYAQCIADAGPDQVQCGNSLLQLGGTPTAIGGIPPYTYIWSSNGDLPASYYLDDTTIANPSLPNGLGPKTVVFKLTIVDSLGATCQDEVILKSSSYLWTLDVKKKQIAKGDSVRLYLSISGGIPPYRYHWSPGHSLNDSTLKNPYASPDTSTKYILLVEDSAGCQGTDQFLVVVSPLDYQEIQISTLSVYPNPGKDAIEFTLNETDSYSVRLFDSMGKLVYTATEQNPTFKIDTQSFPKGVYFYRIQGKNQGTHFSGRLVLE